MTESLCHKIVIDGDIADFLEPKKDPYRKLPEAEANTSPGGLRRNQPKTDPTTGELV